MQSAGAKSELWIMDWIVMDSILDLIMDWTLEYIANCQHSVHTSALAQEDT